MAVPATERGTNPKGYSTDVVVDPSAADALKRTLYRTDASARARMLPAFTDQLSAADLEQFRTDGYLVVPDLLSADEIAAAQAALHDLMSRRLAWDERVWAQEEPYYASGGSEERAPDPELRFRKLAYFVQLDQRLAHVAAHPRLMALVEQILGPDHRLVQDMALLKPPFRGSEKPWHQDTAYFDWTPLDGILGTWIALDRATVENGCMQIVPGSHRLGPAAHFHVRDCQIADGRVRVDQAVVVPLEPGGVLFFSGLLHHGTPPNTSAARRRALQFHYAAAGCQRMTIQQHGDLFNEGGLYAGCRDWDLEAGMSRAVLTA